jgi:glycosyltransferase involved in cell wall biosynthesis
MGNRTPYIIITPARDEGEYIEQTIISVINQTVQPSQWIIVNDGSSDCTGEIIDKYSRQYAWIKPIHRKNRGFRSAGGGVIEAFYDGYRHIGNEDWQYIVKLDGDLQFEVDYFEKCFDKFQQNPKLGIGGGDIYNKIKGRLVREKNPIFHVRGATKIYKKGCWDRLGGLIRAPGWDTLDEVKANQLGWETKTFTDLRVVQLKNTGSAYGNWANFVKNGRANYVSYYHPVFMMAKCVRRIFSKPFFVAAVGLFWGFLSGYLYKIDQIEDEQVKKYIRKEQFKKITFRHTIWK